VFAAMFATLPFYRLLRSRITFVAPLAIVVAIAAAGAGFLLYTNLPWLLAVLQRDTTLTGRTELWHALLPSIMARPWLGYGFNAFWMAQGESSNVMQQVNWLVKDADNGFLNVVLDLGILGLSILVAGYLVFWRRAVRLLRTTTGADAIWHCVYLVLVFLYNLTVSGLLVQNNIFWVIYVSTAVCVSLDARVPVARPAIYFERLSEA